MRREDLEERLDTEVTVTLFDGSEYTGVLRQCGTDYVRDNDNLFLAGRKYYLQYYERWQNGELDMDEMKKDLWEYGGVRLEEREAE